MTDEHIEKTKSAIESAGNIPADKKAELLDLLSKLKSAIGKVSETHHQDAQSIARLVEASAPGNGSPGEKAGTHQQAFARTETVRGKF
jgi:hypothetical protein